MGSRSFRLLKTREGFARVLLSPHNIKLSEKSPCIFVQEELGPTLNEIDFKEDAAQIALMAQQMIRRFQVAHTQELSLGIVHCDVKPENIMLNKELNCYNLIDFDCATTIPSIEPKKRGKSSKVQGTYTFQGTDTLDGDYPSAKTDLDSLGQIILWCFNGQQPFWNGKSLDQLRKEKLEWRSKPWADRRGTKNIPLPFKQFFEVVEAINQITFRPDYEKLYHLFDDITAKEVKVTVNRKEIQIENKRQVEKQKDVLIENKKQVENEKEIQIENRVLKEVNLVDKQVKVKNIPKKEIDENNPVVEKEKNVKKVQQKRRTRKSKEKMLLEEAAAFGETFDKNFEKKLKERKKK